jgi:hypothetical protein
MAEGMDTGVQQVQPSQVTPSASRHPADTASPELLGPNHPPLLPGDLAGSNRGRFVTTGVSELPRFGHAPRFPKNL